MSLKVFVNHMRCNITALHTRQNSAHPKPMENDEINIRILSDKDMARPTISRELHFTGFQFTICVVIKVHNFLSLGIHLLRCGDKLTRATVFTEVFT